ncbi:MAG: glucose-6-phosphate isomerase [Candidatus Margulisiibacteriota bacterium]
MSKNLDQTTAFKRLQALDPTFVWNPKDTAKSLVVDVAYQQEIRFGHGLTGLSQATWSVLAELAQEQQVWDLWADMLAGKPINLGENRGVDHHQTRAKIRGIYGEIQAQFSAFAMARRNGGLRHLVQMGIGGSELGPQWVAEALAPWAKRHGKPVVSTSFLTTVDAVDVEACLSAHPLEETLFVVVSKSGTTAEITTLYRHVQEKLQALGWSQAAIKDRFVAVTLPGSPLDNPDQFSAIFHLSEAIGGRFSLTSAVGGVLLSLAYGPEVFEALLLGAAAMDQTALNRDPFQNPALLSALYDVWQFSVCRRSALAVIPYATALSHFPHFLQQVFCESNGKTVNRDGVPIDYPTAPVVFGDVGTNAQHSFFQLFHQGSAIVPIELIGVVQPFTTEDTPLQHQLNANLCGQAIALVRGQDHLNPNKRFPGRRPVSWLSCTQLAPETLGALAAFYENRVVFQSFLLNINAFDQEGVELGKKLALKGLSGEDGDVAALFKVFL